MNVLPYVALFGWIPLGLYFFRRYPARVAILLNFLGGWAILPSAHYQPASDPFPYWILSVSLETNYFITKATILGFTGLLGVYLFDRDAFQRFRLTFWDLAMVMWCIVPLLSAIANPGYFLEGIRGEIYQLLAWGSPYVLGRLYFTDTASLKLAAKAFVIAGLLYVPICLLEIYTGPQLYAHIYGYEPYRWIGAKRYIGYRPIGFLEGGNQLGIWMATSTLIAMWLWVRSSVSRILGLPIALVAIVLFIVTILCQSGGSIILLVCLMPFIFVSRRYYARALAVFLVLGILCFAGLRLANVVSIRAVVKRHATAQSVAGFLKKIGRGSFGWRLVQDERHVSIALDQPILGYGEWDWWRLGALRPWGLWLLAFGMYGMLGLLALEAMQLIPVVRVVWFPMARSDIESLNLRHALAAAILMSAVDNLLNSSMILPLVLIVGGMSTWESASAAMHVDVQTPQHARVKIGF